MSEQIKKLMDACHAMQIARVEMQAVASRLRQAGETTLATQADLDAMTWAEREKVYRAMLNVMIERTANGPPKDPVNSP